MTWWRKVFLFVCLGLFSSTLGKKKIEQKENFDVKPSGQIGHQTIQLVR